MRYWSKDHPKGPEVGGRPAQRSGSGRETLPEGRKWSEDPPGRSGSCRLTLAEVRSGRETLPEVRKWSGDPPGGPELVGILSQR